MTAIAEVPTFGKVNICLEARVPLPFWPGLPTPQAEISNMRAKKNKEVGAKRPRNDRLCTNRLTFCILLRARCEGTLPSRMVRKFITVYPGNIFPLTGQHSHPTPRAGTRAALFAQRCNLARKPFP